MFEFYLGGGKGESYMTGSGAQQQPLLLPVSPVLYFSLRAGQGCVDICLIKILPKNGMYIGCV